MFHVPKDKVVVLGGKLNTGSYLMIDLRIDDRLIVPTLVLDREGAGDQESRLRFELEGVGARVIDLPLFFHRDIFEANPHDVHFEDDTSTDDITGLRKFLSEIAFARSIEVVTCHVDVLDDGCTPYLSDVIISFKISRIKVEAHFGRDDTDIELTSRYVSSHRMLN